MARISTKTLASLCRRVAIALEAGIDERKIWQRECERARGRLAGAVGQISEAVSAGNPASAGLAATGSYFPPLFHELVKLGEHTGKSATVFRHLADHYDHRLKLRRAFLAGITWPAIQLTAAVVIVGFLIWILGVISSRIGEQPYDVLGLGLQGTKGLIIYIVIVGAALSAACGGYLLLRSGAVWTRPVQVMVMKLPGIGNNLRTLTLSRLAWTLGLSLEAGMDVRKALPFALRSTRNHYFAQHAPAVQAEIERGREVFVAVAGTGAFPPDFLDTIQVGEQSGRLDEAMLRLAEQYQDRARAALTALTTLAGFAVWAVVALLIIAIIMSIVGSYANFIQDLAAPA
jgi:type II secretory pathway component PulF